MLDWSESAPAFKIAKQSSCLCIPFPFSNSHLAKNSLPREAFQATLGTGFEIFTICVKMHFSCSLQFPILSWNGFVARPKYYIYKWKIPSQLFSTFWNRFPFLRPTKMFTSGKSGSFLTLNSVWEKFLSPMIIWQCARFRNQPSFQSGALTGWRPYCALYLDILCRRTSPARGIGASVTGRPATRPVSGWADSSRWSTLEDTIVTGARAIDCKL